MSLCIVSSKLFGFVSQCVCVLSFCTIFLQSLYVVLPALLDCSPFGGESSSEACRRTTGARACTCSVCVMPEAVRRALCVFQTTADLMQQYQVHAEIQSQMFAYLFFFTNASLFNLLIDKGAGWIAKLARDLTFFLSVSFILFLLCVLQYRIILSLSHQCYTQTHTHVLARPYPYCHVSSLSRETTAAPVIIKKEREREQ